MAILRLFAQAREAAGTGRDDVDASTVGAVIEVAVARYGSRFADLLPTCRVWLNGEEVPLDTPVTGKDEVAVLPPVSGGSMSESDRMHGIESTDPATLDLAVLRAERESLRDREDAVSFVRRLAQGRIDLVSAIRANRTSGGNGSVADVVRSAVGPAPSTGSARPPRDAEVSADHPLVAEFESLSDGLGFDDLDALDAAGLDRLHAGLVTFEAAQSEVRKALFDRIDALTAELVRRYKDGGASVDSLLQN